MSHKDIPIVTSGPSSPTDRHSQSFSLEFSTWMSPFPDKKCFDSTKERRSKCRYRSHRPNMVPARGDLCGGIHHLRYDNSGTVERLGIGIPYFGHHTRKALEFEYRTQTNYRSLRYKLTGKI